MTENVTPPANEPAAAETETEPTMVGAVVTDGAYTLLVADFPDTDTAWAAYEQLKAIEDGATVEIEAVIVNIDRKNRSINLSIKAKDSAEEAEAVRQHSRDDSAANAGLAGLGALLKAKQESNKAE